MKKFNLVAVLAVALGLSACVWKKDKVDVVKSTDDVTAVAAQNGKVPAGATALCRDGSYSTATDNSACAGKGGVVTQISRYHSE